MIIIGDQVWKASCLCSRNTRLKIVATFMTHLIMHLKLRVTSLLSFLRDIKLSSNQGVQIFSRFLVLAGATKSNKPLSASLKFSIIESTEDAWSKMTSNTLGNLKFNSLKTIAFLLARVWNDQKCWALFSVSCSPVSAPEESLMYFQLRGRLWILWEQETVPC